MEVLSDWYIQQVKEGDQKPEMNECLFLKHQHMDIWNHLPSFITEGAETIHLLKVSHSHGLQGITYGGLIVSLS